MNFFDKKLLYILLLFCIPLLFLPKINLIAISENETAGLRIDDLILLFFFLILFWARLIQDKGIEKVELLLFSFLGVGVFSFFTNRLFIAVDLLPTNPSSILYVFRVLEYFLFFYLGRLAYPVIKQSLVIKLFFVWNAILLVFQKYAVLGQFNAEGYNFNTYRVSGIASFPSEMGALLNVLFCYLLFNESDRKKKHSLTYLVILFMIFGGLILFTGTRIAIIVAILVFLYRLKQVISNYSLIAKVGIPLFLVLIGAGMFIAVQSQASLSERSDGLFSWENLTLIGKVWEAQVIDAPREKMFDLLEAETYDLSWWVRIHNWCYALKVYVSHPECYLQGIGPGVVGPALDGGLLRIFVEFGIVGTFIFWRMFFLISARSEQLRWITIAFIFNMIFFDAHLAYKLMSIVFFIAGYETVGRVRELYPLHLKNRS